MNDTASEIFMVILFIIYIISLIIQVGVSHTRLGCNALATLVRVPDKSGLNCLPKKIAVKKSLR